MKRFIVLLLMFLIMFTISSCACEHDWDDVTCTKPKTCKICGIVTGNPLGHDYKQATCTKPEICRTCGEESGEALGHNFSEATCTDDAFCYTCNEIGERAFGHNFEKGVCTICSYEDPAYFNPEKYGFENNYGMTKWIEINEYSGKTKTAKYHEQGWQHCIYEFKDNARYDYTRYEELNLTGKYNLERVNIYQIISNDCITLDNGKTYTIIDRVVLTDNNLVIKALINKAEKWFVLEDQIDWEKSPTEDNAAEDYRSIFTYYFK